MYIYIYIYQRMDMNEYDFFLVFSLENEILLPSICVAIYIFLMSYLIGKKLLKLLEAPINISLQKTDISTLSSIRIKRKRVFFMSY